MELKEFINKAIDDIVEAVKLSDNSAERKIILSGANPNRTIEFDIAVSAEEKTEGSVEGGIKVLSLAQGKAGKRNESTNSTVTRIKFGVNVSEYTKHQEEPYNAQSRALVEERRRNKSLNSAR